MILYDFTSDISSDERLSKIASMIPSNIVEVILDDRFMGMELRLELTGAISHVKALSGLEEFLRQTLHLSHIRLYICNVDSEAGKKSMPAILFWMTRVLKTKCMYAHVLDKIEMSEDGLQAFLFAALPDEYQDQVRASIDDFTKRYLNTCFPVSFVVQKQEKVQSNSRDADYFMNQMMNRVEIPKEEQEVTIEVKKQNNAKDNKIPEDLNKDSWEYKTLQEKQTIKKEKKEFRDPIRRWRCDMGICSFGLSEKEDPEFRGCGFSPGLRRKR